MLALNYLRATYLDSPKTDFVRRLTTYLPSASLLTVSLKWSRAAVSSAVSREAGSCWQILCLPKALDDFSSTEATQSTRGVVSESL